MLEEAVNKKLPLPLNFRIEKEGATAITHCGVLEFDAPGNVCYLPIQVSYFLEHFIYSLPSCAENAKAWTWGRREH